MHSSYFSSDTALAKNIHVIPFLYLLTFQNDILPYLRISKNIWLTVKETQKEYVQFVIYYYKNNNNDISLSIFQLFCNWEKR